MLWSVCNSSTIITPPCCHAPCLKINLFPRLYLSTINSARRKCQTLSNWNRLLSIRMRQKVCKKRKQKNIVWNCNCFSSSLKKKYLLWKACCNCASEQGRFIACTCSCPVTPISFCMLAETPVLNCSHFQWPLYFLARTFIDPCTCSLSHAFAVTPS